ncbi:uncharacterized protein [Tursiops truncatus]|uniref:uncharacterized protein n=1 Tax=Tursiops truncatus TaxID=9739 RepID=UPI003CCF46D3
MGARQRVERRKRPRVSSSSWKPLSTVPAQPWSSHHPYCRGSVGEYLSFISGPTPASRGADPHPPRDRRPYEAASPHAKLRLLNACSAWTCLSSPQPAALDPTGHHLAKFFTVFRMGEREAGVLIRDIRGPLTVVASPIAEHRLRTRRLSNHGSRAQPLRGMWDLPGPGHEPVSPASAGGLSTTAPPGKPKALSNSTLKELCCGGASTILKKQRLELTNLGTQST